MAEKGKPRCLNHKCNAILEKALNGSRVPEEEVEDESNLYGFFFVLGWEGIQNSTRYTVISDEDSFAQGSVANLWGRCGKRPLFAAFTYGPILVKTRGISVNGHVIPNVKY